MIDWGLKYLIHYSVTHVLCAIGVHQCFIIVTTVIILCTDEFVDLDTGIIFRWGST